MPKQYPPDLLHFLVSQGVARVIVGHTPHGNCPTVIPHEGLSVIMGDTSPLVPDMSSVQNPCWLMILGDYT